MRRLILYMSIALVTFIIGGMSSMLWLASDSLSVKNDPLAVSLCDLERDPSRYHGRVVRLRVTVENDSRLGGVYTYDWSCGGQHSYNYQLIDVRGFDSLNPGLQSLFKDTGRVDAKGEKLKAEIIVVGIFDADYVDPKGYAFAHHFRVLPKNIEQATPLSRQR